MKIVRRSLVKSINNAQIKKEEYDSTGVNFVID